MTTHIEGECGHKMVYCEECKMEVMRKDKAEHSNNICPERVIDCQFKEFGCSCRCADPAGPAALS